MHTATNTHASTTCCIIFHRVSSAEGERDVERRGGVTDVEAVRDIHITSFFFPVSNETITL